MHFEFTKRTRLIAASVGLLLAGIGFTLVNFHGPETKSTNGDSNQVTRATKRNMERSASHDFSERESSDSGIPAPDFKKITQLGQAQREDGAFKTKRASHWKSEMPVTVPPIPPGATVTPPDVTVLVDGRRHLPRFQGSFSDRMEISSKGSANFSVRWPPEHKTEEILVTTINDGLVNGGGGAVLRKGIDGLFRFRFEAGSHPGATQIVLTAASLAYTLNFWVPTGNISVDPPTLR